MLTIWDSPTPYSEEFGVVYSWNGYTENDSIRSVMRYVETHGDRLRHKYLAWVHYLGECEINNQRLIDQLSIEEGLSYWWMTLFVEKSIYKSPITDAIRLLALEEIILNQRPDKFRLISSNQDLHETVRDLCKSLSIKYEWIKISDKSKLKYDLKNIYSKLPHIVRAIISLIRYVGEGWTWRRAEKSRWFGGDQSLFFCSYFINLDKELCSSGKFYSHHWGELQKLLHKSGYQTNWLQHYLQSSVVPDKSFAMKWMQSFNIKPNDEGFHAFLDTYFTSDVLVRVLKRWKRLIYINWRIRNTKQFFQLPGSQLSFWPLMKKDWQASMIGSVAIRNLLWLELFDKAMSDLPYQKTGLYLCENQAWERALIYSWRKHGHGHLIAVAHSTVRFWDLRYFSDPRTIRSSDPNPLPQADTIALNGKAAMDAFINNGYPAEVLVKCEALRYGYLNNTHSRLLLKKEKGESIKVLIVGDNTSSATIKMLKLLELAIINESFQFNFSIKPHPNYFVITADYLSLNLKVVTNPLGEILHNYDVAYASNMTSAAVDVYLAGLPLVVMLDENELNFSPLRGHLGVCFVSTAVELAEALQNKAFEETIDPDQSEFFYLDPELSRWKQLLKLDLCGRE
jgi:surface carbohydrate biosynthesis protein (TIGR04326 family)